MFEEHIIEYFYSLCFSILTVLHVWDIQFISLMLRININIWNYIFSRFNLIHFFIHGVRFSLFVALKDQIIFISSDN